MNPRLDRLHPYPFERLRALLADVVPSPAHRPIKLSIGEPQHATPALVCDALTAHSSALATYPATLGEPALRHAIAGWLHRRHGIAVDATTEVLPVNGSREALFALAQTVVDATRPRPTVVCPNPFYQIYEGAALLAGARTWFVNADPATGSHDWAAVAESVWADTQLLYVCSPDNPSGAVMSQAEWALLFALSDRHGFVIAADECYSEIYTGGEAPLGSLAAALACGRGDFRRLVAFGSLSKRSNVPGLRSGFVAGDADVLRHFLRYRTYHGSAMGGAVQAASTAAWSDEAHVDANRAAYRAKFDAVVPLLRRVLPVDRPTAGFYLWLDISTAWPGGDDVAFARALLAHYNVAVLPGSLLAREADGCNPGAGRVRIALVASLADCTEAAHRTVALLTDVAHTHVATSAAKTAASTTAKTVATTAAATARPTDAAP